MTQLKTSNLRQSICNEFSEIFRLCKEVLEKATKPSLIKATLETLLRFLSWIPLGYIFETDLLQLLERVKEKKNALVELFLMFFFVSSLNHKHIEMSL